MYHVARSGQRSAVDSTGETSSAIFGEKTSLRQVVGFARSCVNNAPSPRRRVLKILAEMTPYTPPPPPRTIFHICALVFERPEGDPELCAGHVEQALGHEMAPGPSGSSDRCTTNIILVLIDSFDVIVGVDPDRILHNDQHCFQVMMEKIKQISIISVIKVFFHVKL